VGHNPPKRGALYNGILHFRLYALRFRMAAQERIEFPAGQTANLIRGRLGAALRQVGCPPECADPGFCPTPICAYRRLFVPHSKLSGPSGLANRPRPFVLRVRDLEGVTFDTGTTFSIGINLFEMRPGARAELSAAFERWPSARLEAVEGAERLLDLPLESGARPVGRVALRFLTPTELKGEWAGSPLPPFELLVSRIRDRLSTLRALYGEGPLPIDFKGFAQRAGGVITLAGSICESPALRRSRQTGQTHSIGGFVGQVEYQGDLAEFLPYLRAAEFTGVGRQTVWGKGEIRVEGVD
jgi:hypothetical protein